VGEAGRRKRDAVRIEDRRASFPYFKQQAKKKKTGEKQTQPVELFLLVNSGVEQEQRLVVDPGRLN
jgi:hypothetical protein